MTNSELQELAAARLNNSWMAGPSPATTMKEGVRSPTMGLRS